jgi:GH15 family glucan-1,4-alpha-glucosidase
MLGDESYGELASQVRQSLLDVAHEHGYFHKSDHSDQVDGSLLWLCEPFHVVAADDANFVETVRKINSDLELDGGIRRYPDDVYYGSGAWPVLTASLGWVNVAAGDDVSAGQHLSWVSSHIDGQGRLAEQYGGEQRDPENYQEWARRWGPPAADLVWSHAMYVVLAAEVAAGRPQSPGPPSDGQDGGPPPNLKP